MANTPGVADHAAPDPHDPAEDIEDLGLGRTVGKPDEPLRNTEAVRALVLALVGAKVIGIELPDPALDLVVNLVVGVLGLVVSVGLTWFARGKVWAQRRGIDVDAVIATAVARARGTH